MKSLSWTILALFIYTAQTWCAATSSDAGIRCEQLPPEQIDAKVREMRSWRTLWQAVSRSQRDRKRAKTVDTAKVALKSRLKHPRTGSFDSPYAHRMR